MKLCGGAMTSVHHYQVNRDHIGHEMLVSVFAAILRYNASWFPSYAESVRHDGP
jgi:predicted metal-dependent HD superfamily phosphohydrolase